jgi:hypothetical protein
MDLVTPFTALFLFSTRIFRMLIVPLLFFFLSLAAVAQLVEALRYKPEGRGFDSRWCHWNFSLT